jgi:hypothetical protein
MKKITATLLLFVSVAGFTHCKKFVENKKENALMDIMTNGQWKVTSFVMNTVDITSEYSGYTFKYYGNKTVDAVKNGTFEKQGAWDGDVNTMTTWAQFDNVTDPLLRINGSWHIDDSGISYVVASQRGAWDTKIMRLDNLP